MTNTVKYTVIFCDQRSKLVEFHGGDGEKPLRALFSTDEAIEIPMPDAYLLLDEFGEVTGVATHDLIRFWGGLASYKARHQHYQVVEAYIIQNPS